VLTLSHTIKFRRFHPGRCVATPGALEALAAAGVTASHLLGRHIGGDWGDLNPIDSSTNEQAVKDGSRILSLYVLPTGVTVWIITEGEDDNGRRPSTCILLPSEY
jgi:hypothetical protein